MSIFMQKGLPLVHTLFLILLLAPPLAAQAGRGEQRDTTAFRLETLVVTADRSSSPIASSTHAISVLTRAQIDVLPARTLSDALQHVAGVTFVDFDGSGADPQLMMRGFYGGGEAEYALVLVDGRPLNGLENGRVAWDAIPLSAVERIEVVRSPGSTAWGDAAIGGVINVITRTGEPGGGRVTLAGGTNGLVEGTLAAGGQWKDRPVSIFGEISATDGFRNHAERKTGAVGASIGLQQSASSATTISTLHDWRDFDSPGPLTANELAADRSESSVFYRFDRTRDRRHRLDIDRRWTTSTGNQWTARLAGEYRHEDRIRAVALAPSFADTKDRVLGATRVTGSLQAEWTSLLANSDDLMFGVDVSAGRLNSTYYDVVTGPPDAYTASTGSRGEVHAKGRATRAAGAAFFGYGVPIGQTVRFTVGARADWLKDSFDADAPAADTRDATHLALSPRTGVNLRYVETNRQSGHAYVTVGRSFKAPTLDQLFDQRRFPAPFPPFEIGFANDSLDPQHGTNVEAGLYHQLTIVPNGLSAELSLAAYRLDLRDELDFDIETLRYQNLGRSRHSGIEAGLDVLIAGSVFASAHYARQSATNRDGENKGRQLKAIPRDILTTGLQASPAPGTSISLASSSAWDIHLDDANALRLPGWTRWDARVGLELAGMTLWAQAINLFDATYSTTGYPDSADPNTVYFFPAAGRTFEVGLGRTW